MIKKYIIPAILILLLTVGCGNLTIADKLKNNDYIEEVPGNYIKNINDTDYYYFDLLEDSKYFIYASEEKYHIYFFNQDTAIIESCDYDLKNNTSQNGTTCDESQIEAANKLNQAFNEQIKTMEITRTELADFKIKIIKEEV